MKKYVIGLDYGSLSGRALLVDVSTGEEIAESVLDYAHAVMTDTLPDGTPIPKDSALQHPQDFLDVLSVTIRDVIKKGGILPEQVVGIGVDCTASTQLPVDEDLRPLCFKPEFASHPKAYVTMWKDHTSVLQAARIDEVAVQMNAPFLASTGYKCSSENGLAKMLCMCQTDYEVYKAAYRILEVLDWVTMLMTGTDKKCFSVACCKDFWNRKWNGYPSKDFLRALDPRFENLVEDKFGGDTVSYDACFGTISKAGAELTGLCEGTAVALPQVDGHAPLTACGITGPNRMVVSVGTSIAQIVCDKQEYEVPGVFSACPDGIFEGLTSYEFGQSGGGDILAWYIDNCLPASYVEEARDKGIGVHQLLGEKLKDSKPGQSGLLCLDWLNGNRSILVDSDLTGLMVGLTIRTKPEEIYRALMESIVFGTRRILEAAEDAGIAVEEIVACGGISRKNKLMMQMFADITNRPIRICGSKQAPALGTAIYAAVAAGAERGGYASVEEAAAVMARLDETVYLPNPQDHEVYEKLYKEYRLLYHELGAADSVMKRLKAIQKGV